MTSAAWNIHNVFMTIIALKSPKYLTLFKYANRTSRFNLPFELCKTFLRILVYDTYQVRQINIVICVQDCQILWYVIIQIQKRIVKFRNTYHYGCLLATFQFYKINLFLPQLRQISHQIVYLLEWLPSYFKRILVASNVWPPTAPTSLRQFSRVMIQKGLLSHQIKIYTVFYKNTSVSFSDFYNLWL